jgi:hypothetical protein
MSQERIFRIGTARTYGGRAYSVYVKAEWDGHRLSISGVEGPMPSGNCFGGCGQIDMYDWNIVHYAPGWGPRLEVRLRQIWSAYHLNDMHAGTEAQEAELAKHKTDGRDHYRHSRTILEAAGLLVDNGHEYGTAWLTRRVPQAIIDELFAMPETDRRPAWI